MTARRVLRVAAAQIAPPAGIEAGLARVVDVVDELGAAGADLVVFPELTLTGYRLDLLDEDRSWIRVDDPRLDRLRDRCRSCAVTAVISAAHRTIDGRALLAAISVDPAGDVGFHGKQHLHGLERQRFEPGSTTPLVVVHGWRVALAVCFDAAVPLHAQRAADAGADVYAVASFYGIDQLERMAIHMAARAMDHRMYAVAANFAPHGHAPDACGGSGVWGPDGRCLERLATGTGVARVELDHATLAHWRSSDDHGRAR